jgi:hypothetical protein
MIVSNIKKKISFSRIYFLQTKFPKGNTFKQKKLVSKGKKSYLLSDGC